MAATKPRRRGGIPTYGSDHCASSAGGTLSGALLALRFRVSAADTPSARKGILLDGARPVRLPLGQQQSSLVSNRAPRVPASRKTPPLRAPPRIRGSSRWPPHLGRVQPLELSAKKTITKISWRKSGAWHERQRTEPECWQLGTGHERGLGMRRTAVSASSPPHVSRPSGFFYAPPREATSPVSNTYIT